MLWPQELSANVFGNPHTEAGGGNDASTAAAEAARAATLAVCRARPQEYTCVFTSGATGAAAMCGSHAPRKRASCSGGSRARPAVRLTPENSCCQQGRAAHSAVLQWPVCSQGAGTGGPKETAMGA